MSRRRVGVALAAAALLAAATAAVAQGLDLTQGGPVEVTAADGIEWRQNEQVIVARGDARATRGGVTVEADRLIARYRPRGGEAARQPAPQPGGDSPLSGGEIWRLEAEGDVRITSATDTARGDRAVYDMDQAVMVLTGRGLSLTTPQQKITARDSLEYWAQRRMAVARGDAAVETTEGRCIAADTLVAHFAEGPRVPGAAAAPAAAASPQQDTGRLEKAEAYGNVEIRTETEVARGDRGVYSPVTGEARLLGNVRITRGDNQLNGEEAIVNLRGGTARLVSRPGQRVQGLIVPGQAQQQPPAGQRQQQQQRPAAAAPAVVVRCR